MKEWIASSTGKSQSNLLLRSQIKYIIDEQILFSEV